MGMSVTNKISATAAYLNMLLFPLPRIRLQPQNMSNPETVGVMRGVAE